jgi:hypothetical protein
MNLPLRNVVAGVAMAFAFTGAAHAAPVDPTIGTFGDIADVGSVDCG